MDFWTNSSFERVNADSDVCTNDQLHQYCCTVRDKEKRSFQVPQVYSLVVHYVMIVTSTNSSTLVVVCWLPSNRF